MIGLASSKNGSNKVLLLPSGSLVSSSHRLSSRELFRTMPVNTRLPLISLVSTLRFATMLRLPPLQSHPMMDVSSTECSWKELVGTSRHISWTILIPSSSTRSSLSSGCYLRICERNLWLVFIIAQSTRCSPVQAHYQLRVTLQTSVSWSNCHAEKKKRYGLELALLSSLLSDTEQIWSLIWDFAQKQRNDAHWHR